MVDTHKNKKAKIPDNTIYENPKCWEIYMAFIPEQPNGDSHITSGVRPVIVNSNRFGNKTSTEVNVYTMTKRKPCLPVHVRLYPDDTNGLRFDSTVLIEQPSTISKRFLLKKLGSVDNMIDRYKLQQAVMLQNGFFSEIGENVCKSQGKRIKLS